MTKLYNPDEAAKKLKFSPQWVRKLLKKGKLEGQKIGGSWIITQEAIEAYKANRNNPDSAKK